MKRRYIPYIIVGIIVVLLTAGVIYLRSFLPKYQWHENLIKKNDQPYGISVLYDIVKQTVDKEKFHELNHNNFYLAFNDESGASYFYVGSNYFVDTLNVDDLIYHIESGNKAFIASTQNLDNFIQIWSNDSTIKNVIDYVVTDTITTTLKFADSAIDSIYTFHHQFMKNTSEYYWPYFTEIFFEVLPFDYTVLSTIDNDKPNFVSVNVGDGKLYLHTTPIFLSNYHLARTETLPYLQTIWNEITDDEIIWDNSSASIYNKTSYNHLKESLLRFILDNKSFRWAWYVLLGGILLFVIIQSKRKQIPIPLIELKENNTLDYVKAIGTLYHQSEGHKAIVSELMNQFYSFIKVRYRIKNVKEKSKIVTPLSIKSGINESMLSEMFDLELKLLYGQYNETDQLHKLYNLIDYFYKNCN